MDYEKAKALAEQAGFTHIGRLDAATLDLKQEVRDMCVANTCGRYGNSWSCPPACGELEELRGTIERYHEGILVQTVGEMEDSFDFESMMEAEASHKENFTALYDLLAAEYPGLLPLCSGTCTRCAKCTYPDAPCRFPDKRFSSMEAYGILVTEACQRNGMEYYYGPGTIAYTGCFLLD